MNCDLRLRHRSSPLAIISFLERCPWPLPLALITALILGWLHLHPFTAAYGDEALYLMLGQSLRFEGRYAEIGIAGQPPETTYPPGFPILIAGVMALTGTGQPLHSSIVPVKIAVLLLHLLALALLFNLLARHGPPWAAAATIVAVAVHPLITDLSTQPMTDVPFLSAAIAVLWLLDRAQRAGPQGRAALLWAALAGAMAGFAMLIRLPGAILIVCGLIAFWAQRRWPLVVVFVLAAGISLSPWLWHVASAGAVESPIAAVGSADLYQQGEASSITLADLSSRLLLNAHTSISALSSYILNQPWRRLPADLLASWAAKLDFGFGLLLGSLMIPGLVSAVRRKQWAMLMFGAGLQAILLIWPYPQPRYALPLIPFYFFYLFLGLDWLWRQSGRGRSQRIGVALFAASAVVMLLLASFDAGWHTQARRHAPDVVAFHRFTDAEWANYFQASGWAAEHSPSDAVIMSRKPTLTYLFDERTATPFVWSRAADDWSAVLAASNVSFIIEDAFTWSDVTDRFLKPVLTADPDRFELVYETTAPVTRVWRVVSG